MQRFIVCKCTTIFFFTTAITPALANSRPNPAPDTVAQVAGFESFLTSREMVLTVSLLIFGLAIILVQYLLMKSAVEKHVSEIFKLFTVTLIIIGTLILISSGFSSEQIAPALGLFGTIAGYILAKSEAGAGRVRGQNAD